MLPENLLINRHKLNTMNRQQAHKQFPEIAQMTDFLTQHESKLKALHQKYVEESKNDIQFLEFFDYVYHNAHDLVLNPKNN